MEKKLYPCIVYFDAETESKIHKLQQKICDLTGARASLVEWRPHMTVGKALWLDADKFDDLTNELNVLVGDLKSFTVELNGFGYMDNWSGSKLFNCEPYVIYIKVVINQQLLDFVGRLDSVLQKYEFKYDINNKDFHVTLAFKDLDKSGFKKAWDLVNKKDIKLNVPINTFSIATDKEQKDVFVEVAKFYLLN
jgi:2'-5' RNA ligase